MMILTIISLCIAVGGIVLMSRGGVPDSISGLVYNLSERMQWWWSAWLIAVAASVMVPLMTALDDVAWLGWLTVVCLIGAAVTPIIHKDTRGIHYTCGIAAGVLSQVCVACLCPWWLYTWLVFLPLASGSIAAFINAEETPYFMDGYGVLMAECTCAVSLYGALF